MKFGISLVIVSLSVQAHPCLSGGDVIRADGAQAHRAASPTPSVAPWYAQSLSQHTVGGSSGSLSALDDSVHEYLDYEDNSPRRQSCLRQIGVSFDLDQEFDDATDLERVELFHQCMQLNGAGHSPLHSSCYDQPVSQADDTDKLYDNDVIQWQLGDHVPNVPLSPIPEEASEDDLEDSIILHPTLAKPMTPRTPVAPKPFSARKWWQAGFGGKKRRN